MAGPPAEGAPPVNSTSARRSRQTQAERSTATRKALLNAAIKCLFEYGYGSTTTILVAEAAGVSRGAMLHQFPSKADLMTFVVEAVFEEEVLLYREMLKNVVGARERLLAYPHAVCKLMGRPAGVAIMEIFQGSRSDPVLAEKLKPVQDRIDAIAIATLESEIHRAPSIPLLQLVVAVGRGLAIGGIISPALQKNDGAIELFQRLLRAGIDNGVLLNEDEGRTDPAP